MTPLVRDKSGSGMSPPIFRDATKNVEVKFGLYKIIIGPVDINTYTLEKLRDQIYADFAHAVEENAHLLITYKRGNKENILVARQQCLSFAFAEESNPIIFNVTSKSMNACDATVTVENLCVSPFPSNELYNGVERLLQTQTQPPTPVDKIEAPPLQDPKPDCALEKRLATLEKDAKDEVAALKDEWTNHQLKIQTLLDEINKCLSKLVKSNYATPAIVPVPSKTGNASNATSTSCNKSTGNTAHAPKFKSKAKSTWFADYLDELHSMGCSHTMPFTHPHQVLYPAGNFLGQQFMPQFTPPVQAPALAPAPAPAPGPIMAGSLNGPINFHQMAHPTPTLTTNFGAGYNNYAYYSGYPQMAPPTPTPTPTPMNTTAASNGYSLAGPPSLPSNQNQYTMPQGNYTGQQWMPPPLAPSPSTKPEALSASAAVGSQPNCSPIQTQQSFSHSSTIAPSAPPTVNTITKTVGTEKCNGLPPIYTSSVGMTPVTMPQIQDGKLSNGLNGDNYKPIYPAANSL